MYAQRDNECTWVVQPTQIPTIQGDSSNTRAYHVVEDDPKRNPEKSIEPEKIDGCVD